MGLRWREFSRIVRTLVRPKQQEVRRPAPASFRSGNEFFQVDPLPGGSVLEGHFQVGERFILLTHRQWEGDSHPMSLQQRKEILRKTLQERMRRSQQLQA